MPDASKLQKMNARFAPTDLKVDLSGLSDSDRQVLAKLVDASKIIDGIFLRQVWSGNVAMMLDLSRDDTPEGRARFHYFRVNKGPWSRLDKDAPFVSGAPAKPANGNFYPDQSSKADIETWIGTLSPEQQTAARGFFSVIRQDPSGKGFMIVPYNLEYQPELLRAAALLRRSRSHGDRANAEAFPYQARAGVSD